MTETEDVLTKWAQRGYIIPEMVDAIAQDLARVGSGAVPPQDIDRDALDAIWPWHWSQEERDTFTDKVLALVRPVEGAS